MDKRLLIEANKDVPLYFNDFKTFWDETQKHFLDKDLKDCYASTLIFKNWRICLNHINIKNLNTIIDELHEDINTSFFQSYFGLYRTSHMHLRSIIELSMQLIYFHQHEVEFKQWETGDFVIKHETITNYLKKHPNLKSTECNNLIDQLTHSWKNFSKHIHAETPLFFQSNKESHNSSSYSRKDFGIWKTNFLGTSYLTNKLLIWFFKNHINLFPTQNRELLLRNMTSDDLKTLELIR